MKTYFISGIAADRRLFRRIQLPLGFEPFYVDWIKPLPNETLPDYAGRLAESINVKEPFILIGTSLGGIMATEIAKSYQPKATIIISSIPINSQLPRYFRIAGKLKIQKLIPASLYKLSGILKHHFAKENAEDKKIIIQMIRQTDDGFIRWGIDAVLKWKNKIVPKSLYQIHGTKDELFPYSLTSPAYTIPNGDHSIVLNRADEVNKIIAEILKDAR